MLSVQNDPHLSIKGDRFLVSLARSQKEIREAQRLRYQVFAEEMGADIVSDQGLDIDYYDEYCQHLIVRELCENRIVGCYRLLTSDAAYLAGGWYSATEFDLSRLHNILPYSVELGRACVHKNYRTGQVITLLWAGLVQFMNKIGSSYMIGCGSVSMADGGHFAASLFHQIQREPKFYAPVEYRVFPLNPLPLNSLKQNLEVEYPALIKGYLRAGAYICGEPHWDADFNSADMLVMMPMSRLSPRYAQHLFKMDGMNVE